MPFDVTDEETERVVQFFRQVAVTVVREGSLFPGEQLTAREAAAVAWLCVVAVTQVYKTGEEV
jgi:hypothetical protein